MVDLRELRERRGFTTLLILKEIAQDPNERASTLAEKLGISIQAASDYLKEMQMADLIERYGSGYRPTEKGVQYLQEGISALREFILDACESVSVLKVAEAIAFRDLTQGERVNLQMVNGFLYAGGPDFCGSTGVVVEDCKEGEIAQIKDLDGIIEHSVGIIVAVTLRRMVYGDEEIKTLLGEVSGKKYLLIPLDERGEVFLRKLKSLQKGVETLPKLPPVGVPYLAVIKGINALLIGSQESIGEALRFLKWLEKEYGVKVPLREFRL